VTQMGSEMKCYVDENSNTIHLLSRKAEEGPNVPFHSTTNGMEIQGIEAGTTRGIESLLRKSAGRKPAAKPSISGVVVDDGRPRQGNRLQISDFGALLDRRLAQC
jgi:hypothetical protein